MPWGGVDPIVVASQIVMGLQTIPSRQLDATLTPSIVTVGAIHGGLRSNIIPDSVEMIGTLRTFDADTRVDIHERLTRTAQSIAESAGATAEVKINLGYPVTRNDNDLTAQDGAHPGPGSGRELLREPAKYGGGGLLLLCGGGAGDVLLPGRRPGGSGAGGPQPFSEVLCRRAGPARGGHGHDGPSA